MPTSPTADSGINQSKSADVVSEQEVGLLYAILLRPKSKKTILQIHGKDLWQSPYLHLDENDPRI